MIIRNPEKNFEELWKTFHNRYPFFELRNVDWKKQYDTYRPKVTRETSDDELFNIFCQMLAPLHDGHVELIAKASGDRKKRYFTPEKKPRFWQEFTSRDQAALQNDREDSCRQWFRAAYRDSGLDASLLQVTGIWLHPDPRAGRR